MNLKELAEQRRQQIYSDLLKNKYEHDAVYINTHALSVKFKINVNAIINDIKYLLDKSLIIPYIPAAKVYKIFRKNYVVTELNNCLNDNIINKLDFTEQEKLYLIKFEQHRKNINKPLDAQGYEMMIARAKYMKNKGENIIERIEYSISGGYSQIYETKNKQNNNNTLTFKERDEQNRINKIENTRQYQTDWFSSDKNNDLRIQNNE